MVEKYGRLPVGGRGSREKGSKSVSELLISKPNPKIHTSLAGGRLVTGGGGGGGGGCYYAKLDLYVSSTAKQRTGRAAVEAAAFSIARWTVS